MMRLISTLFVAAALLTGCQAAPKATVAQAPATTAVAAGPHLIQDVSNQTVIYSCPKCGMDFDAAGLCSMDSTALVKTDVAYICPADDKPVEHAGSCPRCNVNARVVRTTAAVAKPAAGTANGS